MIHQPISMASQCGAGAWLNGLASGDQHQLTGSGSALVACSRRCAIQVDRPLLSFNYFTFTVTFTFTFTAGKTALFLGQFTAAVKMVTSHCAFEYIKSVVITSSLCSMAVCSMCRDILHDSHRWTSHWIHCRWQTVGNLL